MAERSKQGRQAKEKSPKHGHVTFLTSSQVDHEEERRRRKIVAMSGLLRKRVRKCMYV